MSAAEGVCGYCAQHSATAVQCSTVQVALCNCRGRGGGDKWMRCREVEEERAVNGRFWCLARMNKSGFDASADHISTAFGQLQSVFNHSKSHLKTCLLNCYLYGEYVVKIYTLSS